MRRRLTAARATKNLSRAMPFVRFFSATFLQLRGIAAQFLYRNCKNVIYRQTLNASFAGIKKIELFNITFEHNKAKCKFKLF